MIKKIMRGITAGTMALLAVVSTAEARFCVGDARDGNVPMVDGSDPYHQRYGFYGWGGRQRDRTCPLLRGRDRDRGARGNHRYFERPQPIHGARPSSWRLR